MNRLLQFLGVTLVFLTCAKAGGGQAAVADIPASGVPVPELAAFDAAMRDFMGRRQIPAGVLCVSKGGRLLLERGYGWQDAARRVPLQPGALFRIASLCKPVTAAAIRTLLRENKLKPDQPVFDLGQPGGGILKLAPLGTPDPRLKEVNVSHLLEHKGGWDRELSGDPMFQVDAIARAAGSSGPATREDIARYMMGRPLDHAPGTTQAYSNFGYLLLGLVIEKVSGQDYEKFIARRIFAPAGVAATEVAQGRSLPSLRNPREPWYSDTGVSRSVFDAGQSVPSPDGGFLLEVMGAHGGLISTARAYSRFLGVYWIDGQPRTGTGQSWSFLGSLPGTWTLGRQRPDGVDFVAFFNQRADSSGLSYEDILRLLDAAADTVVQWPSVEVPATGGGRWWRPRQAPRSGF